MALEARRICIKGHQPPASTIIRKGYRPGNLCSIANRATRLASAANMLSAVVRTPSTPSLAPASNAAGMSWAVRMSLTRSDTPKDKAAASSSFS